MIEEYLRQIDELQLKTGKNYFHLDNVHMATSALQKYEYRFVGNQTNASFAQGEDELIMVQYLEHQGRVNCFVNRLKINHLGTPTHCPHNVLIEISVSLKADSHD
jgi:hypothetical protein